MKKPNNLVLKGKPVSHLDRNGYQEIAEILEIRKDKQIVISLTGKYGNYYQEMNLFNSKECRKLAKWLLKVADWLDKNDKLTQYPKGYKKR